MTLHAVLVLPGLAWLLGRRPWEEDRRVRVVRAAVASYAVVSLAVLVVDLATV